LRYGNVPFVIFKHEDLEREYNLHPTESNERKLESWQLTSIDVDKGDLKRQVAPVVKPIVNLYRFQTVPTPETGYDDINSRPERWLPKKKKKRRYGRQI
jgi:hypothetical protein